MSTTSHTRGTGRPTAIHAPTDRGGNPQVTRVPLPVRLVEGGTGGTGRPARHDRRLFGGRRGRGHVIDPTRIRTEVFGAGPATTPGIAAVPVQPPHPPAGAAGTGPSVSFARSGLTVDWDADYASLLELAEACGVPTRWSCRTGVCHTCEIGLLSGAVDHSPEPVEAPADGNALICCSRPRGDLVLDL